MSRELGLAWGAAALALVLISPFGAVLASALAPCPFHWLTGIACPTCGTTRAALALAGLDPMGALAINPLATVGWTVAVVGGAIAGMAALLRRPLPRISLAGPAPARAMVALAVLANWAYLVWAGV